MAKGKKMRKIINYLQFQFTETVLVPLGNGEQIEESIKFPVLVKSAEVKVQDDEPSVTLP